MRVRVQRMAVGLVVLASLVAPACAEATCQETRTCENSAGSGGGPDGGGGTTWTGGTGGGTGGAVEAGSFAISVDTPSPVVIDGATVELNVSIDRNGMTEPITLDLPDLPQGVTADPVTVLDGFKVAKVVIAAAAKTKHGTRKVTLRAEGGGQTKTVDLSLTVRGQPGSLDTSFALLGEYYAIVMGEWTRAYSAAVAPDGKIYVVGDTGDTVSGVHAYFILRFTADGDVDQTFGTGGFVVRYTTPNTGQHVARSVFVDAQSRPVVGGYFSGNQLLVARFETSGALDTTFAVAGELVGPGGMAHAIAAHGTKIVGAGKDDKTPSHALVGQVDANGVPDTTFGAQSFAIIDTGTSTSEAVAVAVDADNKVVAAGNTTKPGTPVFVARLKPGGQMDTFGTSGIAYLDPTNGAAATSLAVRPDRRVVVGGGAAGDKSFVMQLDPQGALDGSFGDGGRVLGAGARIDALALDGVGRVVTVGRSGTTLVVNRLESNGGQDTTFSSSGGVPASYKVIPYGVTLLADGRALVVGASQAISLDYLYLARIWM